MSFSNIIGQEFVIAYLRKVWKTGRLPHAFLFAGSNGVGKTTTARALAMLKYCSTPNRETSEPCTVCEDCIAVEKGEHPDMCQLLAGDSVNAIKIGDAADIPPSDPYVLSYPRTVREVLYSLHRKPVRGKGRFLLLQHSEKLTVPAANALLKSIEEPSSRTLCVLTTSNAESNLPTIVSRCHVLRFRNIPAAMISEYLQESMNEDPVESDRIAVMSHGSLARAADICGKGVLHVRQWVRSRMENVGEWDVFALSEEMREIAPGMVIGFDGEGKPNGKTSSKGPLRQGLQQMLEMMLEYLRDVSVVRDNPPSLYFEELRSTCPETARESLISAQEHIEQAYSGLGRNVNPAMVIDNLLFSLKHVLTDTKVTS